MAWSSLVGRRRRPGDPRFVPVVTRAACLIYTTPAFDDLARVAGLRDHRDGATDPAQRQALRAELNGLVAHLYELTEAEFAHILTTFPLVPEAVKAGALERFRIQSAASSGQLAVQ